MAKVLFNIKKVQFSKITSYGENGLPAYGTPLKVPGAVSLSMDNESSKETKYADGIAYFVVDGSNSYSGALEIVNFPEEVLKEIFGWKKDENGNLVEVDCGTEPFAMQFAVDSDDGEVYFTFFNCSASRPNNNFQTKESGVTINNQSSDITMTPITLANGDNIIKSYADKTAKNYATYFTAVTVPKLVESI